MKGPANAGPFLLERMHLVQLLLPLVDERAVFDEVMHELTERFGGVTAYTRAPASGRWKNPSAGTERDDIIVVEVMVQDLDKPWWDGYRRALEQRLGQKELVVRAHAIVPL
jgi:hypothetical protein